MFPFLIPRICSLDGLIIEDDMNVGPIYLAGKDSHTCNLFYPLFHSLRGNEAYL